MPKKKPAKSTKVKKSSTVARRSLKEDFPLYLMFLPALIWIAVFRLAPMPGLAIAFTDYNIFHGFWASDWVGLEHFRVLFTRPQFLRVLSNTIQISLLRLIFVFPLSVILALMLNEIRRMVFKRTVQTIIYLPFFVSIVVVHGIFVNLLSTQGGIVNEVIGFFGGNPINFYTNQWFRFVLLLTDAYQGAGWGTIVYLAALAGVDVELYEAAQIDGAGRLRQLFSITLPSIMPIIMLMLVLRIGGILNAGTEQILVMYNPTVYATADVLGTLIFREGLGRAQFGFTTAVGMFESVISFVLLLGANFIASKCFKRGVW